MHENEISEKTIGAAIEVHRILKHVPKLGPGFQIPGPGAFVQWFCDTLLIRVLHIFLADAPSELARWNACLGTNWRFHLDLLYSRAWVGQKVGLVHDVLSPRPRFTTLWRA